MNLQTLNDVFFAVVERDAQQAMLHKQSGSWTPISARQLYQDVVGVARALQSWGIVHGDRVAILSENRPEWTIADFASLLLGAVTVPIYPTLTEEQTAYLLCDAGVRVAFVSSEKHLRKLQVIAGQTPLERIVVMDELETNDAVPMPQLMRQGPKQRDAGFEAAARKVAPADLATIIYTSGTTGIPKGAMLSHGNMASNLEYSLQGFCIHSGQTSISFLPLSHVTARHVDFAMLYHGVRLAYVPHVEQLPQALLELQPAIFVGVPRVYEKIHAQVELKTQAVPRRWIYRWALSVGKAHLEETLAGDLSTSLAWKLADRLVYSQVRTGMGGKAEIFISGGAPLGRELAEWYAKLGIRIHEGYGLTETSPVIAVNTPGAHRLGSVGKPLPNIEVRIADDGEILVRGPSVFSGYWKRPEETREALVDGWFKTGDIGRLDEDGFLYVTDRKKDLIKTSGGKFIAPQPIENSLKHHSLVGEAVIVGDKQKFPAVLIVPNFTLLEGWARSQGIAFTSRTDLLGNAKVRALYDGIVEEINQKLARFEKLKKTLLLGEELSADNGTLTASMKMRRRAVTERYRSQIEGLYANSEPEVTVNERG
ncbi:MAG: long-chain fatty acid--CoA ligase [Acidobacteria bacterium]|nr:long-chain fatty acid--CoA ligase [Acidobacteriota bacterium]